MGSVFLISIFLFILSALGAYAAVIKPTRGTLILSKGAYLGAVMLVGVLLVYRMIVSGLFFHDFFDGILISIIILGVIYIAAEMRFSLGIASGFLSGLSLLLALIAFLKAPVVMSSTESVASVLRGGHIFFVFMALASLSSSFLFAVFYLLEDRFIKQKDMGRLFFRLPSLELSNRLNFIFMSVGTASLFVGVMAGFLSWKLNLTSHFAMGPASLLTLFMLFFYTAIIILRQGPMERKRRAAHVTIYSYSVIIITFLFAHRAMIECIK